ncbi:hypothetical protein Tco_0863226 [Tanacetum coccineum]
MEKTSFVGGFIRKVYGILAAQMVLTTLVSFATVLYAPANETLRGNSGLLLFIVFLPFIIASSVNSTFNEESLGGLSVFKNVGKSTKDGVLGTVAALIHMVAIEGGQFKE